MMKQNAFEHPSIVLLVFFKNFVALIYRFEQIQTIWGPVGVKVICVADRTFPKMTDPGYAGFSLEILTIKYMALCLLRNFFL